MKGKLKTEEQKRNIGKFMEKFYSNPKNHPNYKDGRSLITYYCVDCGEEISVDAKRCVSCNSKLLWQNFGYREKTIKARNTPELKEKDRRRSKKQWQDGKMDGVFMSPTKPEKEIMRILENFKLDYIFQYRPENYSMIYDFYIPNLNLLIEFDGIYWHSSEKVKKRDKEKTEYAEKNNYNLLRIDEHNLHSFKDIILEKDSILNLLLKN